MCQKDVVHFIDCLGTRKKVDDDLHPSPTSILRPGFSTLPDTLAFRKCVLTPESELFKPDNEWACFHFGSGVSPVLLSSLAATGSVSGDPELQKNTNGISVDFAFQLCPR